MVQFRQYIRTVFSGQLRGTVNDVRGDASTALPTVLEDLAGWPSVLRKFNGEANGSDFMANAGGAWVACKAVS